MTTKVTHPADTPLYPIREVSRLTGVNSVTLRAWERRYGLIRPQRTAKGHRLYAYEDVERVEQILQWLNRGVPVSQVRELLDQPAPAEPQAPATGDWSAQRQQWQAAVEALDLNRLDALYHQAMTLYPVATCVGELFRPLVASLEEHWGDQLGARLQRATLEAFLRSRIGTRLYHANQSSSGGTVLISRLPEAHGMLWELLIALTASDAGYRVQLFDDALPLGEIPLAVQRLGASAMLVCSGQAERTDLFRRQLPKLADQLEVPLGLCGPVARIREQELQGTPVAVLGDDPIQAVSRLKPLIRG
ncbi:MerR family transcriptional regulator [Halomonas sp. YLGW01]|uniref:MerR family transcriptional regulator n=1 Tax=Halomonas sp. YLGW01 TaxID=2773308 RepID=UPI00177CC09F|nr:MerR family transcriptional regulator [Halomonas sp. YLGW01]